MYGSIGKLGITGIPMATNQAIACAMPNGVHLRYLYWWLRYQRDDLVAAGKGGAQQNISQTVLKSWPVPLAPLPEQERITTRLDLIENLLSGVVARLRAARCMVQQLHTAALQAAYEAAKALVGGGTVPLDSLLREPLKNGYSARPVTHETPVRVLSLTATTSGSFDPRHFKYTDERVESGSPLWLTPGDLLIQRGNTAEYVGVAAVYDGAPNSFIYPDLMIRARLQNDVDPRFVWYMLLAPQARTFLRERATGTAGNMPKVNQATVRAVPVPLPRRDDRQRIVERLDRAFGFSDAASRRVEALLEQVDRLGSAARSRAFAGDLVATEAELAKMEGRGYETANDLLVRIASAKPGRPVRRHTTAGAV